MHLGWVSCMCDCVCLFLLYPCVSAHVTDSIRHCSTPWGYCCTLSSPLPPPLGFTSLQESFIQLCLGCSTLARVLLCAAAQRRWWVDVSVSSSSSSSMEERKIIFAWRPGCVGKCNFWQWLVVKFMSLWRTKPQTRPGRARCSVTVRSADSGRPSGWFQLGFSFGMKYSVLPNGRIFMAFWRQRWTFGD